MRWMRLSLIALCVAPLACSQYHPGDTYAVSGADTIYLDEQLFRDAIDRKKAGVSGEGGDTFALIDAGKLDLLGNGAMVKVVESTSGGAKVVVSAGSSTGKVGWMLESSLGPDEKR